ncbi:hypothetical protein WJX75_009748 [Coccomyxa subellipsoidea]|uniref:Uncharacterized protein n=1 Tax=Coccomyxa subellipsoidea TaxID=248742 RepID=A0ABR2YZ16_9CHLO
MAGVLTLFVSSGPKKDLLRSNWRGGSDGPKADLSALERQQEERAMSSRAQDIAQLEAQVRELERQVAALVPRRERAESKVFEMPAATHFSKDDLAAAVSADITQLPLVKAGRQLRQGVRTVVALDAQPSAEQQSEAAAAGETWVFYPNDLPKRSAYSGDTRWALTPFLAHQALNGSSYKWLLFGGADTVFFPEAVLQMLEDFDPQVPYIITDNLWWGGQHGGPNKGAPRCLPCHSADNRDLLDLTTGFGSPRQNESPPIQPRDWGFAPPVGCPCTPQLLCGAGNLRDLGQGVEGLSHQPCTGDVPFPASKGYSIHGGAGVIFSIGLLEPLSLAAMEECVRGVSSGSGEAFLTECLWTKGFAPTDPGFSVYRPPVRLFDPFQWTGHDDAVQGHGVWEMTNRMKMRKDRMPLQTLLSTMPGSGTRVRQLEWDVSPEDTCNLECQDLLHYMVSAHVASSSQPSTDEAAKEIRRLAAKYAWWWDAHKRDAEPATIYWSIDAAITSG